MLKQAQLRGSALVSLQVKLSHSCKNWREIQGRMDSRKSVFGGLLLAWFYTHVHFYISIYLYLKPNSTQLESLSSGCSKPGYISLGNRGQGNVRQRQPSQLELLYASSPTLLPYISVRRADETHFALVTVIFIKVWERRIVKFYQKVCSVKNLVRLRVSEPTFSQVRLQQCHQHECSSPVHVTNSKLISQQCRSTSDDKRWQKETSCRIHCRLKKPAICFVCVCSRSPQLNCGLEVSQVHVFYISSHKLKF